MRKKAQKIQRRNEPLKRAATGKKEKESGFYRTDNTYRAVESITSPLVVMEGTKGKTREE